MSELGANQQAAAKGISEGEEVVHDHPERVHVDFQRGGLVLRVEEDLGRKVLRRAGLAVDALGRNLLADPVVGHFHEDLCVGVPLLSRQGEIPNEDVARFQVTEENVSGVKIGHCICYLWTDNDDKNSLSIGFVGRSLKRRKIQSTELLKMCKWVLCRRCSCSPVSE